MKRLLRIGFVLLLLFLITAPAEVFGWNTCTAPCTDSRSYIPPDNGPYRYSPYGGGCGGSITFAPGVGGFPSAGGSFDDPVFGTTITRISENDYGVSEFHGPSYAPIPTINLDNSYVILNRSPIGVFDLYTTDGSYVWDIPVGWNTETYQFSPIDKDILLYYSWSSIKSYNIQTEAISTLKTLSGTLYNGGTGRFTDSTGRYFLACNNGSDCKIWDRVEDVTYAGSGNTTGFDYAIMSTDGSGFIMVGVPTKWYPLNHVSNSIESPIYVVNHTPHGDLKTDDAGVTWFVAEGSGIPVEDPYCVGCTGSNIVKIRVDDPSQHASIVDYVAVGVTYYGGYDPEHHISCNAFVDNQNYCLISVTNYSDSNCPSSLFSNWSPFHSELYLVNVKDDSVLRIAHHRSRSPNNAYYRKTFAGLSYDGTKALFASNMGRVNGNYSDAYIAETGLGSTPLGCTGDAACDDGLFCNGAETCNLATDICEPGTPVDCGDDGVGCTDDQCDEIGEACANTPNNGNCDNGLFCDGVETCDAVNDCQEGTPVNCSDGVGCTDDACDEVADACANVANDGNCNDGDLCTTDTCDPIGDCVFTHMSCSQGEQCDPGDGQCKPVGCTGDGNCDDGLFCNGAEACNVATGMCQSGTPVDCGDGVSCTDDICDDVADACVSIPNDSSCDNGFFCDGVETCDAVNDCREGTPVDCSDGVVCTHDACDERGNVCINAPNDADCDDGDPCTLDSCDLSGGCANAMECSLPGCDTDVRCLLTVDLDIVGFQVTKNVKAGKQIKEPQLTVVNRNGGGQANAQAILTGVQDGVEVYNDSRMVFDLYGNGRNPFGFPPFTPTQRGTIVWTVVVNDTDSDDDTATATTRVR